ncbi:MAG: hypothetical protein NC820_06430 [Candidatus Omnitrophica bacterium]|nr:hypothetical protein [Candidatus Omnitrophota bacterium]
MSSKDWKIINSQIDRSKILRFPWREVLGESLTSRIHKLKNKGHNSTEVKEILLRDRRIKEFIIINSHYEGKIRENIIISVSARFGESKTAEKLKGDYGY